MTTELLATTTNTSPRSALPMAVADPSAEDGHPNPRILGMRCRNCGRAESLGPNYVCAGCFGPLEIAYDFPVVTHEEIEAGPPNIWRYKALLLVPTELVAESR